MTHFLAINDNHHGHHGRAATRLISLSAAAVAAARVAGRFILTWESRITANRYVRLAAFSVVMTLTTMVFVGFSLELAFHQSPHQSVRSFTAAH
jgi:hypothetical protein